MAGQGVVNIGLNVDYQESLQKMTKDFKSEMSRLSNELKKIEISKDTEKQIGIINKRIDELASTADKTFSEINNKKLDSTKFEKYYSKIKEQFTKIDNDIKGLSSRFGNIDGTGSVERLTKQFDNLRNSILSDYQALDGMIKLINSGSSKNSFIDKAGVNNYKRTLSEIRRVFKEVTDVDFSSSSDDDLFSKLVVLEQSLQDQIAEYKRLKNEISSIPNTDSNYVGLENDLFRAQSAAYKTSEAIQELDREISSRNLGAGMEDSTRTLIGTMDNFEGELDTFATKAQKIIRDNKELRDSVEQTQTAFNTFQIKNGAVRVPVEVATKSDTLQKRLKEIIDNLQSYADSHFVVAKVKLTLDGGSDKAYKSNKDISKQLEDGQSEPAVDISKSIKKTYTQAVREAEKVAKDAISSIQDIFASSPIKLSIDRDTFTSELKEIVSSSLSDIAQNTTGLNVNESLREMVSSLREVSTTLTGTEGFKLGLDEASINRITSSIENMANMIKRAFGVASDSDIANQWAVIEDKFKSAAGEEGKLLAKNKEHKVAMQELAVEYKKYLDMGGEKTFSDLSSHRYTVQNLTKAYEDLGKSVQETTQKQEKQKTTQKTSKADSEAIRSTTKANKSLETQADKTSTAIKNEANSAQLASEKFRKLAKEKGNATIANRELAKAAKETADALEREAKARKEAENSRGSKNAVDSGVYNANALDWQIDIKQKLLDSGNYAEIYGAQISQLANGNVQFVASVRAMVDGVDDEWKKLTAVVDGNGNVVSRKFKDLSDKQIKDIEKAKEQARRATEALAQLMNGEETEAVSYDRDTMEQLVTDAVKATQAMEGLDAKYKATLNNSGGITIIKTLTEANGVVKTFTAEFDDVKTVINAANSSVEEFSTLMNEAFDRAKVSISTKSVKADTSDTETVISHYEEMYEVIKKINDLDVKISGLDDKKNVNQLSLLRNELKETAAEYLRLTDILNQKGGIDSFSSEELDKLLDLYEKASEKIEKIKAKLADGFVAKGYSALDSFNKKYSGYEGYGKHSDEIARITEEIKTLSSQEGLDSVKKKLQDIEQELSKIKTNNANEIKFGTIIEGKTFSDINELRSNIVSLMSNIGEVNEKSIKIKGAKSLSAEVKKTNGEIHNMTVNLDNNGFAHYVDNGIAEFKRLGSAAESVFKGIKDLVRIYLSPQDFIRYFRQGFDAVTEVDTALTELIKVSDASDNAIAEYFDGAVESAKELGSSVTDMISATSEWARLGYNLPDSKKLGEVAVLYKNVGDGIDIDAANESLVSTLQGFQLEADDAISIVDKFNEVSNNFAISSGGLGEALKRSAAAFNAANTDLSGAIALITTGNEVVQSPEKVGTMWQTVSARIRGKFCAHCTAMCRPLYEDNILVA